jgi:hypothetical protein
MDLHMERVVISDAAAVTGARMFIGFTNTLQFPQMLNQIALTNAMGFGQLSTDATQRYLSMEDLQHKHLLPWEPFHVTYNTAWDIVLFAYPNVAGKIGMEIKNFIYNKYQ